MTIGVPGFGTDGQMDRQTEGQKIVIAGGERSVYRDSGWILSRIILIAGGRRSMYYESVFFALYRFCFRFGQPEVEKNYDT